MFNPGQMFLIKKGVPAAMSAEATVTWLITNSGKIAVESQLVEDRLKIKDKQFEKLCEREKFLKIIGPTLNEAELKQVQEEVKKLRETFEEPPYKDACQEVAFRIKVTYDELSTWAKSKGW
jgi:predicted nuclease with TOPRIM domain